MDTKVIGSVLISVGTSIGAGMLALPMVGAPSGYLMSVALMIVMWILITLSALLIVDINLTCPKQASSFDAMAYKTLGRIGQAVTWVTMLCLHYALLAAYSSGASVLLSSLFHNITGIIFPNWITAMMFVVTLGGAVFWSTKAVDYTNRFFISIKGLLLFTYIILLLPHVDMTKIIEQQANHSGKYLGVAAPIFLGSFGFLATIPSIRLYIGEKHRELRVIIICSTTISLLIYLAWLLVNLGVVPLSSNDTNSFKAILSSGASVDMLINAITAIIMNEKGTAALVGFSSVSMTTSFLGVSLGLFDFLAEGCKRPDTRFGRLQTAFVTFIPPLIFALYYPKGFIVALGYAAVFMVILEIVSPALMAYKLQKQNIKILRNNKFLFNKFLLTSIIIEGLVIATLQVMSSMQLLPTLVAVGTNT